ncbi:hypothetical protein ACHAWO_012223 [Cyclotella atomus]|uniref:LAGLIDADG homing endonuclease n=1 Tax=Cyclotella atomus TaxID=382360 RepID=A0ABD3NF11_9STRA
MFGIWIGNTTNHWSAFCNDVECNFGELTWDIFEQKLKATRLSRTFQKKMNLYLYIPPASAHPAGCIKGTVFGLICRYYAQNTFQRDFVHFAKLLYRRASYFEDGIELTFATLSWKPVPPPKAKPILPQPNQLLTRTFKMT